MRGRINYHWRAERSEEGQRKIVGASRGGGGESRSAIAEPIEKQKATYLAAFSSFTHLSLLLVQGGVVRAREGSPKIVATATAHRPSPIEAKINGYKGGARERINDQGGRGRARRGGVVGGWVGVGGGAGSHFHPSAM